MYDSPKLASLIRKELLNVAHNLFLHYICYIFLFYFPFYYSLVVFVPIAVLCRGNVVEDVHVKVRD